MAIKRQLLIPPKSARPRGARWLDECRQRSFAALRACPESSEGMTALPDFGDAICYYRYYRFPEELEPPEPQEQNQRRKSKLTNDELRARLTAATQALDSLLQEFVQQGYRAEMSNRLQEIVNHSSLNLHLFEVYVLPGDMDALLHFVGNPLADYDAYETEEEAEAHAPAFDLSNPEHRAALKESIFMVGR